MTPEQIQNLFYLTCEAGISDSVGRVRGWIAAGNSYYAGENAMYLAHWAFMKNPELREVSNG